MFIPSLTEFLVIVVVIFLFFGAKRLPDIGAGLGKTLKEIRKAKKEFDQDKDLVRKGKEPAPDKESLEAKLAEKVIERIPGAGKVKNLKDKADKIKDIVS